MTSRIVNLAVDAHHPDVLAQFWCQVLGWAILGEEEGVVSIGSPDGGMAIDLVPVPEPKPVKNRLHLDLRSDGSTQAAEVERLIRLGARRADVGQGPDASWAVLSDPEGNEFCVLARSVQQAALG